MHHIPDFAHKIIERSLVETNIYESLEDYFRFRKHKALKHAVSICKLCGKKEHSKVSPKDICISLFKPFLYDEKNSDENLIEFHHRINKRYEFRNDGHVFEHYASVTNEFGENINVNDFFVNRQGKVVEYSPFSSRDQYDYWIESSISPKYRGIKECDRDNFYHKKFKHYPKHYLDGYGHRPISLAGEINQFFKTTIDENAPKVRGKRGLSCLKESIYNSRVHRDRSWKRAKFRKQWLVNIK